MAAAEPFQRVNRESTAGLITRQLREAIMYGRIAPGAQLSEAALAAQFGVSRGPLREATQRLVQEGLVRAEPNRGLFVKELDAAGIRDLYAARIAVEAAAGRMIIRGHSAEAVAKLRTAYDAMQDAAERGELAELSDADLHFHEVLVDSAGSPRLQRMHKTLMAETRMCLTALQGTYQDPEDQVAEHRRIAEAIAAGDADELVEAVELHMQEALDRLVPG
ncbi:GntR family transcriptional regulator [Nesterenkonia alkaliphila]|uniref:FCD domain-containing protein n=1 Tax=Nesterenkonia alkaliphila TaxID=1463631 RepID=A0A7K1UGN9_9MICC|nr:GntR family transcriptional regulator [Nesterenkonia alkaliphila]MVT25630.1 FCD domain-containing protein [Nesterenkonia alkaliphila]GFZ84781.1 putative transcriptional regulator, GntR family protein [Nesterenkonia alkaliphila]